MKDSVAFVSPAPIGARIGVICLFLPILGVGSIALLDSPPALNSLVLIVVCLVFAGTLLIGAAWRTKAYLTITGEEVVIGFAPLWRTRLSLNEIADVSVRTIDPYAQYRGWGIKGSSKAAAGRLYSAGGTHSTVIRTTSQTTYLVAFGTLETAQTAETELHRAKHRMHSALGRGSM
ncbi:MAG TPA: hypothetical protein VNJ54_17605 [Plantibacter sp.]|uniref:hypothetical protein n=1 Tax=unclassified Plantibacter TaxID=2624265 RepID=UPI002C09B303|nr:hypothetical protein [Plantibacter sp.]